MQETTCSIPGCDRPVRNSRGWCGAHYQRWQRTGDPLGVTGAPARVHAATAEQAFWLKIRRGNADACWVWTGCRTSDGYGQISRADFSGYVHRFAYELLVGPIPDGLVIDHLCRNRACCNPAHLEPVTIAENVRRGTAPAALAVTRNHCKRGHEFTPENTYIRPNGHRKCKACRDAYRRMYGKQHLDQPNGPSISVTVVP